MQYTHLHRSLYCVMLHEPRTGRCTKQTFSSQSISLLAVNCTLSFSFCFQGTAGTKWTARTVCSPLKRTAVYLQKLITQWPYHVTVIKVTAWPTPTPTGGGICHFTRVCKGHFYSRCFLNNRLYPRVHMPHWGIFVWNCMPFDEFSGA